MISAADALRQCRGLDFVFRSNGSLSSFGPNLLIEIFNGQGTSISICSFAIAHVTSILHLVVITHFNSVGSEIMNTVRCRFVEFIVNFNDWGLQLH